MRRRRQQEEGPGQDSFLDIVANLVGILIILVMIVGVRAQDAFRKSADEPESAERQLATEVAEAQETAESVESNINRDLAAKLQREQAEISQRRATRDQLNVVIAAAEHLLAERREKLDDSSQAAFDLNRQVEAARQKLQLVKRSLTVAMNSTAPAAVVNHRPTPLAKTVFGKEIYFRLREGRLAYVPKEELEEAMKADLPRKVGKLKKSPVIVETVGPIRGFLLKYTLRMKELTHDSGFGMTTTGSQPVFDHYTIEATSQSPGEPFESALRPDSLFRRALAGVDPQATTVTVWVYPDSYGQFRTLKDELYRLGFLTASWPMPEGVPIAAGPGGHRSVVQ